nr:hypothetical transcript [Hymenolepis microstoma]
MPNEFFAPARFHNTIFPKCVLQYAFQLSGSILGGLRSLILNLLPIHSDDALSSKFFVSHFFPVVCS